ncbi:MAG: glycogen synthase [Candidatus Methanolliviera sp. GoM_oil]|nr:MAG: glycogen synthase [Candidatus Methanolliviera sp. GoM_oil]
MRIAVIAKGISPFVIGGAEKVTKEVVNHLRKRGHEIKVITKYKKEEDRHEIGIEIDEEWSRNAALEAMRFEPDVIYICRHWGESASLYVKDVPIVSMYHDIDLDLLPISPDRYSKLEEITRRCLKRDDKIVVASQLTRDYYIENFLADKDKFSIIPLGLDEESDDRGESKKKVREGKFKILYLGRIAPNKGIHILLKALKKICENNELPIELTIYGGFTRDYASYYSHLSNFSRHLPVKFAGRVREEDKTKLYQSFDAVVCPSIAHEGFGLVPLEALRYNGIVIASDIFVKTGVLSKKVAFVYPRTDVDTLASRLKEAFLMNESERSRLRRNAKRWVERFSWERHVRELEKILILVVLKNRRFATT